MKFGIGQSVPRKEDPRMITGGGQFTDDINLEGQLHLRVMRSPYAHGLINAIDTTAAHEMPGVIAIYTADDIRDLGPMPCRAVVADADGNPAYIPERLVLASDKVAYVGQPIAAVIATTAQAAQDAVEMIGLELDDLPANVDPAVALAPDTPVIHDRDSNLCVHYENGDAAAVDAAFAACVHRVEVDLVNNRVAPSPLEPRSVLAVYADGQYVIYNPSQGPVAQQGVLANAILRVKPDQVRVISLDTGGGFGIRGEVQPEVALCAFAAKALGRPVKYRGDRSEMFLTDSHGRDNLTRVTGGFDAAGDLRALRVETTANLGAYCSAVGPFVPTVAGGRIVGTVYKIPHVHHSVRTVFTNTQPVAAYRGAGRPEACYVMERLFEEAAIELQVDSIALRKQNFIQPEDMPYTLPSGVELFSGEFAQTLDLGLRAADYAGFPARAATSQRAGKLRGIGVGFYVESSGGGPEEEAAISLNPDGSVDVVVGTHSHGQGHRTTYSQILSEQLGIEFDKINIIQGDTREVKFGGGTGGSRSSQMGGVAVRGACIAVLDSARSIAAEMLQTPTSAVSYAQGRFTSAQNNSEVSLAQVAQAARQPQFGSQGLRYTYRYNRGTGYTFPNGAHIAEVEVDPDTGVVDVVRYSAVDDCGRVINPLLAAGQVHGGVMMGVGQTLYENVVYATDGQLLTGSLMDYAMPRASHVCDVEVAFNEVLDPNNELGVKGIGEGGACGAPPAVVNAALDALRDLGVTNLDMPLTSESVWRAIRTAREA
ncbi:MAG: xanthine dehydrogenase family protein molybdopterin-binding subunit [Pseudomonadota bacterium]